MSVTNQQVITLLENVLFETATQAAVNAGAWINNSAASSVSSLASAMANSGEAKIAATVVGYYLASLGRAPNAAEVQYYVAIAEKGLTATQIAAGQVASNTWDTIGSYFAHSPEFSTRGNIDFSLGQTGAYLEAVPWLYQSVLGRAANSAELAYYDNQVINGVDLGTLFREFTASPEFHTDTDTQIAVALASFGTSTVNGTQPPAVAVSVTLGSSPPPSSTPSPAPTPSGPVHTDFTIGTDHFTSSNAADTFSAILGTGATLTANDSLHGAGNVLTITDTTAGHASQDVLPSGVSLTSITEIDLTTSGNAGTSAGTTLDLSGVTGLSKIVLDSSGTHGDFLNTGSAASVSVTAHGAGDVLNIADASLATLTLAGTVTGVTFTDPAGPTSLTVDISGLTLSSGFTDASNHVTNLTVNETGTASTLSAITDNALTSATFSSSGGGPLTVTSAISAPNLASLTLTGNVQLSVTGDTVSTGITVSGATDNAAVTITAPGQTATGVTNHITLGNGDNALTLGTTATGAVPGATEIDKVTWKAMGSDPATESLTVFWQDFNSAAGGTETIGGFTVTGIAGTFYTAAEVATVAAGGFVAGLSITSDSGQWNVSAGPDPYDSTFISATANATVAAPSDASSSGGGDSPTLSEDVVGSSGAGGSESIGGATVSTTINGAYTAAQIATVAGGGSVTGLSLTASPTLWTIGAASGATTDFTSTTANHAEAGPTGAGSTGDATNPTSVQQTAGVTTVTSSGGGGVAGSTDSLTLGNGNNTVTDYTVGTLHLTAGNSDNTITSTGVGATLDISLGTGSNSVVAAADAHGTITFAAHSVADSVTVTSTGSSTTNILVITGLNATNTDSIHFTDAATGTATQITSTAVTSAGGSTSSLSDWVATADGAAGGGVTGAAHHIVWFQFGGNTYLLESVAGQTADQGVMAAGNSLVELAGTSYTFTATAAAGVFHLG